MATFISNGTPITSPSPQYDIPLVSNNGVLKVSKNLFDYNARQVGYYQTEDGSLVEQSGDAVSDFIRVQPNTTYYLSNTGSKRGKFFDANKQPIQTSSFDFTTASSGTSFTTGATTYYVRFGMSGTTVDRTKIQLEQGSTATAYHPYGEVYVEGEVETIADSANHTATVATLLGVGDYRDTQNINTGAITRNVGVKVLDGTENWAQRVGNIFETGVSPKALLPVGTGSLSNQYTFFSGAWADIPNNGFRIAGTQLRIRNDTTTSTEQFKQWLADQYANGTPVIVIYPLATPTTESVAGQTLQVQAGDNTLEITQASLNNLELEAKYEKSA